MTVSYSAVSLTESVALNGGAESPRAPLVRFSQGEREGEFAFPEADVVNWPSRSARERDMGALRALADSTGDSHLELCRSGGADGQVGHGEPSGEDGKHFRTAVNDGMGENFPGEKRKRVWKTT